jgi:hypothetical protein
LWQALCMRSTWKAEGEEPHAPVLLRDEVASALALAVSAGQLASEDVVDASQRIGSVPIVLHQPKDTPAVVQSGPTGSVGSIVPGVDPARARRRRQP